MPVKGRFGSTINGAIFYSVPQDGALVFRRTDAVAGGDRTLTQNGIRETQRLGFNGSASAFYDINAYNALNTSFSTRGFGFDVSGDINGEFVSPDMNQSFSFVRNQIDDNINDGFDWNTDYTRKFEGNDVQELVLAYQLSKNNQDQEINILETNTFEFLIETSLFLMIVTILNIQLK